MNCIHADPNFDTPFFDLSGKAFSNFYLSTESNPDHEIQQYLAAVWLQTQLKVADPLSLHLLLTTTDVETSPLDAQRQIIVDAREAYTSYLGTNWELRIGRMIQVWGRADGFNPTDFLTAKDLTVFNPDDEVKRRGFLGLWLTWTPEFLPSVNLTGVLTPAYAKGRLLFNSQLLPVGASIIENSAPLSALSLSNIESAFQLSYTGYDWDMALVVFLGRNHSPFFSYDPKSFFNPFSQEIILQWDYQKISSLGISGSRTQGSWVYRWEGAYTWADIPPTFVYSPPSHLDWVLGAETELLKDTRFEVQYLSKWIVQSDTQITSQNPIEIALQQQLSSVNAQLQNYQNRYLAGLNFTLRYSNEDRPFSSELHILLNLVGLDYLVRPQIHYSWTDHFKTTAGIDIFGGPSDRPFGILSAYNSAYLELRYLF